MLVRRVVIWLGVVGLGVGLVGCSAQDAPAPRRVASHSEGPSQSPATQPLAFGTFAPGAGISGDMFVEAAGADIVVRLSSFNTGGQALRLVLTDSTQVELATCVPSDANTASVGGTPAGPTSTFTLAKRAEFDKGAVPRFTSGVLLRQRTEADPTDCAEPVAAIAPLSWSE